MADSKEVTVTYIPNFLQELFPSAERTALLFHLSYLCLANFPKLEWLLKKCAIETQLLFGSSEALLLQCTDISDQLVSLLLPQLKLAVEKNESVYTETFLEKSKELMISIIDGVKYMVHRYEKQNHNVILCINDVIIEKAETRQKIKRTTKAYSLGKVKMETQKGEMRQPERDDSSKNCVSIMHSRTMAFSKESFKFSIKKSTLRKKDSTIQVKLTEIQMELASLKMECDTIPDPVHLNDVQKGLSQIQNILIQLQKFWELVGVYLEALKDMTVANEHFIEDSELKDTFMKSIDSAQEEWKTFGEICLKARGIFCLQTKDAYKFLETSPTSLSAEEWKKQYDDVIVKLNKMSPVPSPPQEPAAITE